MRRQSTEESVLLRAQTSTSSSQSTSSIAAAILPSKVDLGAVGLAAAGAAAATHSHHHHQPSALSSNVVEVRSISTYNPHHQIEGGGSNAFSSPSVVAIPNALPGGGGTTPTTTTAHTRGLPHSGNRNRTPTTPISSGKASTAKDIGQGSSSRKPIMQASATTAAVTAANSSQLHTTANSGGSATESPLTLRACDVGGEAGGSCSHRHIPAKKDYQNQQRLLPSTTMSRQSSRAAISSHTAAAHPVIISTTAKAIFEALLLRSSPPSCTTSLHHSSPPQTPPHSPSPPPPPPLPSKQQLQSPDGIVVLGALEEMYEVCGTLGSGSHSVVYHVQRERKTPSSTMNGGGMSSPATTQQQQRRRKVSYAAKVISLTNHTIEEVLPELEIALRMSGSPWVPKVNRIVIAKDGAYVVLVMEMLKGGELFQEVRTLSPSASSHTRVGGDCESGGGGGVGYPNHSRSASLRSLSNSSVLGSRTGSMVVAPEQQQQQHRLPTQAVAPPSNMMPISTKKRDSSTNKRPATTLLEKQSSGSALAQNRYPFEISKTSTPTAPLAVPATSYTVNTTGAGGGRLGGATTTPITALLSSNNSPPPLTSTSCCLFPSLPGATASTVSIPDLFQGVVQQQHQQQQQGLVIQPRALTSRRESLRDGTSSSPNIVGLHTFEDDEAVLSSIGGGGGVRKTSIDGINNTLLRRHNSASSASPVSRKLDPLSCSPLPSSVWGVVTTAALPTTTIGPREAVVRHYLSDILCAIKALHESNIVHRDIKLENIMKTSVTASVTASALTGCISPLRSSSHGSAVATVAVKQPPAAVKIIDFGFARVVAAPSSITTTDTVGGGVKVGGGEGGCGATDGGSNSAVMPPLFLDQQFPSSPSSSSFTPHHQHPSPPQRSPSTTTPQPLPPLTSPTPPPHSLSPSTPLRAIVDRSGSSSSQWGAGGGGMGATSGEGSPSPSSRVPVRTPPPWGTPSSSFPQPSSIRSPSQQQQQRSSRPFTDLVGSSQYVAPEALRASRFSSSSTATTPSRSVSPQHASSNATSSLHLLSPPPKQPKRDGSASSATPSAASTPSSLTPLPAAFLSRSSLGGGGGGSGGVGYGKEVDVWAAGVCLYALLFGKYPFEANRSSQQYKNIMSGKYNVPLHLAIAKQQHHNEDGVDLSPPLLPKRATTTTKDPVPSMDTTVSPVVPLSQSRRSRRRSSTFSTGSGGGTVSLLSGETEEGSQQQQQQPTLECVDLLHRMLTVNPDSRITATDALRHPWFTLLTATATTTPKLTKPTTTSAIQSPFSSA